MSPGNQGVVLLLEEVTLRVFRHSIAASFWLRRIIAKTVVPLIVCVINSQRFIAALFILFLFYQRIININLLRTKCVIYLSPCPSAVIFLHLAR